MVKRLQITRLLLWMPEFGCRFKAYDHRSLGLLASDTPDVVPVGKVNTLSPQLSEVLYINLLTKLHSRVDRFFLDRGLLCFCACSEKNISEEAQGCLKAMLLPDKHRAPYNFQSWDKLSTPSPSHWQHSSSTSEHAGSMNRCKIDYE